MWRHRPARTLMLLTLVVALLLNTGVVPAFAILSLKDIPVVEPTNLYAFVKGNPNGTPAERAQAAESKASLIVLGKALFWDMQVGSDNVQACASCHFNAGADSRSMNQLNPNDGAFGNSAIAGVPGPTDPPWEFAFGPNISLSPAYFPFHLKSRPTQGTDPAAETADVIRDTNDVVSSQGVRDQDTSFPSSDGVFNWMDNNVRRVEPRNAPSMVNAVFHLDMFWDGRASFIFNGVNPFGFRDRDASVSRNVGTAGSPDVQPVKVRIPFASHASQSVGPPLSGFEMAGTIRSFPELADKILDANPLGLQLVHPNDGVLGPYAKAALAPSDDTELTENPGTKDPTTGDDLTYRALIQDTFKDEWWNGEEEQYRQNFSLFFGLALQAYQATLVADDTPFDRFMGADANVRGGGAALPGDPTALTAQEQLGLDIFQGTNLSGQNPGLVNGRCINCHILPETSNHTVRVAGADPAAVVGAPTDLENVVVPQAIVEAMPMGAFVPPVAIPPVINPGDPFLLGFGLYDVGFYNIGVRPTAEDLGRKRTAPATTGFGSGLPVSYVELARMKQAGQLPPDVAQFVPDIPAVFPNVEVPLADGTVQLVDIPTDGLPTVTDGAFKVPTLRNQEFQGPYFHTGSDATLRHVVEFYARGGNFPGTNANHLDPDIAPIPGMDTLTPGDQADIHIRALVAFLARGLTDPRVKAEAAPFDHPQLVVPDGANGRTPGEDRSMILQATGAAGGSGIVRFLGLSPQTPGDPNTLGRITGTVTDADTGDPLIGIEVTAHRLITDDQGDPAWQQVGRAYTTDTGAYRMSGLPAGSYKVRFFDEDGTYISETYDGAPYALSSGSGTNVPVTAGNDTTGIDAALVAVGPDAFETDDDMLVGTSVKGDVQQARTLDRIGDQDWITFDARNGNTYVFETSGDVPLDTLLELYDIDGNLLLQNNNGGAGSFSKLTFVATANGPLYLRIRGGSADVVGPYTLSVTATDVTPPETTSDAVASYTGQASITLTATDDWSGVASTRWRIDGAAWVEGTSVTTDVLGDHTLEFYSVDNAGNEEDPKQALFTVVAAGDTTPPVTTSDLQGFYSSVPVTITLSATDEPGGSGVKTTYWRWGLSGPWNEGTQAVMTQTGFHIIQYYSVDNAGNEEQPTDQLFHVVAPDTTPPVTSSDAQDSYVTSAHITLSAYDGMEGSGVASTHYRLDGGAWVEGTSVTTDVLGDHTLEFYSVDNAGNEEDPKSVSFEVTAAAVDQIKPVTTTDADDCYYGSATIMLSATDEGGSGVKATYWRLDGGDWHAGDSAFTDVLGVHTLEYFSEDNAGNDEFVKSLQFEVLLLDTVAPVTMTDAQSVYTGSATIELWATDEGGSGVDSIRYSLDGGTWTTGTQVFTDEPGQHVLEYCAVDKAGNGESTKMLTFTVIAADVIAPVTTSNARDSYEGTATIMLSATDVGSGVAATYYRLDDQAWQTGTSVTTTIVGEHTLDFYSVDLMGNEEVAKSVAFTVVEPGGCTVERADGASRFDGSVVMARNEFPGWEGVTDIVIASGDDRAAADPLAAAGLCGTLDAPLFLVSAGKVDSAVKVATKEIAEAADGPVTVHLVGGTASVPDARFSDLVDAVGGSGALVKSRVLASGDRYDLAAAIARTMAAERGADPSAVLIANGADPSKFFDALALSPISAAKGYPVLLVSADSVPGATKSVLKELDPDTMIVAGGEATVRPNVFAGLGGSAVRWSGADRYETAIAIADHAVDELGMTRSYVGIAAKLPDALTGGSCIGRDSGVLVLTNGARLTPATGSWIATNKDDISSITIYGGPKSVLPSVADAIFEQAN